MNKDVVYIEPEEDITDIISKIEGSKSKIVALVPPKKAGVFRSIVNIKLISKTAANADKTVVLVTTDSSIIKLAAATKMPVTKDLKSAPKIPEPEDEDDAPEDTEVVDVDEEAEEEPEEKDEKKEEEEKDSEDEKEEEKEEEDSDDKKEDDKEDDDSDDDKDDDKEDKKEDKKEEKKADKKGEKKSKLANSNNPVLKWIGTHQKLSIGIGVGFILFIFIMIWALVIAPAVTITLKLETLTGNFSENVSFTDKLTDENVKEGKFYIEEKKIEDKAEVEFDATGKKNVGEKATGKLTVYHLFKSGKGNVTVAAGTKFTYNNKLVYVATEDTAISWGGKDSECKNKSDDNIGSEGCYIYKDINVRAAEAGAAYNIAATGKDGWAPNSTVVVVSSSAMTGGTDKEVTVVQQSDVEEAVKKLTTGEEAKQKKEDDLKKIKESLEEGQFMIESSFKQTTSDPVSDPEVGKEVAEGKKAKITVTATTTVFVIDETKLKEFITEKAKLEKGYKIYEMKDPFVENFSNTESGYVGKLKTSYVAGSTVTENDVVETAKGKGIGTAKRDISDHFDGIKSIDISTSMPWVTSVPGNPEKITVIINTDGDKKE